MCYGALASLIPLTCYEIFGPSASQLLSFKLTQEGYELSILNHHVAVQLYEDYIFKGGVLVALVISFLIVAVSTSSQTSLVDRNVLIEDQAAMTLSLASLFTSIAYVAVVTLNKRRFQHKLSIQMTN